ncbi:MAG: hypothetical protein WB562_11495, partial [Candidatus Sulfotelmatobacter sp.]
VATASLAQIVSKAGQKTPGAPPRYTIAFKRGDPVAGIDSTPAIRLPFDCTSDGTVFVTLASFPRANSGLRPLPPGPPPMLLTSVPRSGDGRTFRLDRVPDLHISEQVDSFAFDSGVLFLVNASQENKPQKRAYTVGDYHGESTVNTAEQSTYILVFSREGEYKRTIPITDEFEIRKVGVFPSGTFLALGYDRKDHIPRLVMLKEDGTLLKPLEIPKEGAPESMSDSTHTIVPSQLVSRDHTIIIAQTRGNYPLLEISEGGSIRAIRPKLGNGEQLESLIPADKNIYVVARRVTQQERTEESIYEVRPEDGTAIRSFTLSETGRSADSVACVIDGKFLSLDYGEDKVVRLIGSAEPIAGARGR